MLFGPYVADNVADDKTGVKPLPVAPGVSVFMQVGVGTTGVGDLVTKFIAFSSLEQNLFTTISVIQ